MCKFEEIYSINVNDKTEKKGQLTYLSWAWAWAEFKKKYPKATYSVDCFDGTYCTGNEKLGWMVRTEVFADDLTYEMWLPIMDMRNNAILQPKMTDVNKTIMRCLTKNLAMFGLGLYIYAGEDLPEAEQPPAPEQPAPAPKPAPIICSDCQHEITACEIGGKRYSANAIAKNAEKKYGRKLCADCSQKQAAENKGNEVNENA